MAEQPAPGYGPGYGPAPGYGPGYGPGYAPDLRPIPDPTLLTSAALLQALDQMRRELTAVQQLIEARLDGMDKATELIRAAAERVPSEVDGKMIQMHALYTEKFASIAQHFQERRNTVEQMFVAERDARAAALNNAREALAKAEMATEKRFEEVGTLRASLAEQSRELMPRNEAQTLIQGLATKVNDLNDRLNRREGTGTGMEKSWAILLAVIGVVGIGSSIVFAVLK